MLETAYDASSILRFMRLIEFDSSDEFRIIININKTIEVSDNFQIYKQNQVTIQTTINKARFISSKINELHQRSKTISEYQINLNVKNEKNATRKVYEIFQILLSSIGQKITISDEYRNIYSIIKTNLDGTDDENIVAFINVENFLLNSKFKGILNHLREKNIRSINITASTCDNMTTCSPQNVIKYENDGLYYLSRCTKNDWICFDFKMYEVQLEHYSIKVPKIDKYGYPKKWVIEGSKDNEDWTFIDKREYSLFTKENSEQTFHVQKQVDHFRFIRMRMLDTTGVNIMVMSSFEMYGKLYNRDNQ
ncbi:hypothetical protein M9Y10_006333 [Tritrichomonas musculus]|uniref:SUN domain-containing protein n=1 Tax=Tritrichomonas musculus TaxID=1915356 RepID=A0ABR2JE45_9EUKA